MTSCNDIIDPPTTNPCDADKDHNYSRELKQKSYHLLILHHSAKCRSFCDKRNCLYFKSLWKHMSRCNNDQCLRSGCRSSREILSHYIECKDFFCKICLPVRYVMMKGSMNITGKSRESKKRKAALSVEDEESTLPTCLPVTTNLDADNNRTSTTERKQRQVRRVSLTSSQDTRIENSSSSFRSKRKKISFADEKSMSLEAIQYIGHCNDSS